MVGFVQMIRRTSVEAVAGCFGAAVGFYTLAYVLAAAGIDSCKMPASVPGFVLGMPFGCAMFVTIVGRMFFRKYGSAIAGVLLAFAAVVGALVTMIMCPEVIDGPWLAFVVFGVGSALIHELLTLMGNMEATKEAKE